MQSGIKVADKIKVNNQVTSRWGNDLGLPGWAQCNHEAFKGGRGRSDTLSAIAGFEDGTGQQIKGCSRQILEIGKTRNHISPKVSRKKCSTADAMSVARCDQFPTSDLQSYEIIDMCCLRTLNLC